MRVNVWASVLMYQFEGEVTMPDGQSHSIHLSALSGLVTRIRQDMYQQDRGTWFSAELRVDAGRKPEVSYNYDDDPEWFPDVSPEVFARDLEAFPRAEEHIPAWLRRRLARVTERRGDV